MRRGPMLPNDPSGSIRNAKPLNPGTVANPVPDFQAVEDQHPPGLFPSQNAHRILTTRFPRRQVAGQRGNGKKHQ